MGKRFEVVIELTTTIELEDAVIEAVDDEWRSVFYSFHTPEDIAGHIAYNMVVNRWPLSSLDGWANQPDKNARIIGWPEGEVTGVAELEAI